MTKKRCLILIAILLVGGILIVFLGVAVVNSNKHKLDFKEMFDFEIEGLNTKGTINVVDDFSKYDNKLFLEQLFPDDTKQKAKEKLTKVMNTVEFKFSKETDLENGDKIIIEIYYDENLVDDYDIKTKNVEFTIEVEGLPYGDKIDAFYGLDVIYSGISGKGTVVFDNSYCDEFVREYVKFYYVESNLKNGDIINVVANYDPEIANSQGKIIESETKEYTVSGLIEGREIDPFENLSITYTGASPYLTVSIDSSKCDSTINEFVSFTTDTEYVRNGDKFIVNAVYDEYIAQENGFILNSTSKSYTVENQPEYITSLDGLDLKDLQSEINDKLAVVTAANEGDVYFAKDIHVREFKSIAEKKLNKTYLISLKPNFEDKYINDDKVYNRYVQIYEYTINRNDYGGASQVKAYIAIFVDNIRKSEDGTLIWDFELWNKSNEKLDSLINDYVISEKEYYNVSEIKES